MEGTFIYSVQLNCKGFGDTKIQGKFDENQSNLNSDKLLKSSGDNNSSKMSFNAEDVETSNTNSTSEVANLQEELSLCTSNNSDSPAVQKLTGEDETNLLQNSSEDKKGSLDDSQIEKLNFDNDLRTQLNKCREQDNPNVFQFTEDMLESFKLNKNSTTDLEKHQEDILHENDVFRKSNCTRDIFAMNFTDDVLTDYFNNQRSLQLSNQESPRARVNDSGNHVQNNEFDSYEEPMELCVESCKHALDYENSCRNDSQSLLAIEMVVDKDQEVVVSYSCSPDMNVESIEAEFTFNNDNPDIESPGLLTFVWNECREDEEEYGQYEEQSDSADFSRCKQNIVTKYYDVQDDSTELSFEECEGDVNLNNKETTSLSNDCRDNIARNDIPSALRTLSGELKETNLKPTNKDSIYGCEHFVSKVSNQESQRLDAHLTTINKNDSQEATIISSITSYSCMESIDRDVEESAMNEIVSFCRDIIESTVTNALHADELLVPLNGDVTVSGLQYQAVSIKDAAISEDETLSAASECVSPHNNLIFNYVDLNVSAMSKNNLELINKNIMGSDVATCNGDIPVLSVPEVVTMNDNMALIGEDVALPITTKYNLVRINNYENWSGFNETATCVNFENILLERVNAKESSKLLQEDPNVEAQSYSTISEFKRGNLISQNIVTESRSVFMPSENDNDINRNIANHTTKSSQIPIKNSQSKRFVKEDKLLYSTRYNNPVNKCLIIKCECDSNQSQTEFIAEKEVRSTTPNEENNKNTKDCLEIIEQLPLKEEGKREVQSKSINFENDYIPPEKYKVQKDKINYNFSISENEELVYEKENLNLNSLNDENDTLVNEDIKKDLTGLISRSTTILDKDENNFYPTKPADESLHSCIDMFDKDESLIVPTDVAGKVNGNLDEEIVKTDESSGIQCNENIISKCSDDAAIIKELGERSKYKVRVLQNEVSQIKPEKESIEDFSIIVDNMTNKMSSEKVQEEFSNRQNEEAVVGAIDYPNTVDRMPEPIDSNRPEAIFLSFDHNASLNIKDNVRPSENINSLSQALPKLNINNTTSTRIFTRGSFRYFIRKGPGSKSVFDLIGTPWKEIFPVYKSHLHYPYRRIWWRSTALVNLSRSEIKNK